MLASVGALLPRDFLDRQPKRWQKSQRKRRVTGFLKKMKEKRIKVEERTYKQKVVEDLGVMPKAPQDRVQQVETEAVVPKPKPSSSTPIGPHAQGVWAAHLEPNQVLVVKIPEGVRLCLLRASLCDVKPSAKAGRSAVRCRTPAKQLPTALCYLQPLHAESCALTASFGESDKLCAIAAEGTDAVHLVGCYTRNLSSAMLSSDKSGAAAASAATPAAPAATPAAPAATPAAAKAAAKAAAVPAAAKAAAVPAAAPSTPTSALMELGGGLKCVDTKVGNGRRASNGNKLTVRYVGACTDRNGRWSEFDSNEGKPFHFTLGAGDMIRGWELGLVGMKQGGTRRLIVPPSFGYGPRGAGPVLPNATLVFEISLLNVV